VSQAAALLCQAVRWVSDEPFPGWVEVVFTDADGRERRFFDKPPIFDSPATEPITKESPFPVAAALRVTVVGDGDPAVMETRDVDSDEGESHFRVPASTLVR
jgi:hypothetical protein